MHNIYFFTDIHGFKPLYDAIIEYCFTEDDSPTIIFGGDACDRGPEGYSIMKDMLNNPHIIYLKGNHEDIFVKAARQIKEKFDFTNTTRERVYTVLKSTFMFDYKYDDIQLAINNGGMETLADWIMDGMSMDIIESIDRLPYTFSYEQYDFCHAGGVYPNFKRVSECEYNGTPIDKVDSDFILWDRHAFGYGWAPGRTCIHGHTPIPYLTRFLRKIILCVQPLAYSGNFNPDYTGEKIDMDTGTIDSNKIFVLNVLTRKAQGFKMKKNGQVKQIEEIKL